MNRERINPLVAVVAVLCWAASYHTELLRENPWMVPTVAAAVIVAVFVGNATEPPR